MNTLNRPSFDTISDLIANLTRFADAGIDPAFDNECEELERQFAELRFTSANN